MPNIRGYQQSFNGGVVTPEFWGRLDDQKYQTGLAVCDNFIVLPHGPVTNAPGTQYVNAAKYSAKKSRLMPFTYSTTQTMVLEFADQAIRFHSQGQSLLTPTGSAAWSNATTYAQGDLVTYSGTTYYSKVGTNLNHQPDISPTYWYALGTYYEIPSPYLEADLFNIEFVQSNDVLSLTHVGYAPRELRRYGATNWQLTEIAFGNLLATPTTVAATPTRGAPASAATKTYSYVVTSASDDGKSESEQSSVATAVNNLLDSGAHNDLTWDLMSGVTRYNVYRLSGGLYGFMGTATTNAFEDDGTIIPDTGFTPPITQDPFATDYPGAVSYFEQRRMFGGTTLKSQNVWMTRSGTESDLNYAIPTRDDDAISFKIAARQSNTIRHIVPMSSVVILTSGAVFRLTSVNSDAITPSTISVQIQSGIGANTAQPVVDDTTALYVAARGGHVRELGFDWQTQSFTAPDLSLRCPNLFDGLDITQMDLQRAPTPVVWCVSTSGDLIGMTYVPEQEVRAWFTRSTSGGVFESVAVVSEDSEDRVYVVVRRTINGSTVRYVERMAPRMFDGAENAVFVDCAGSYDGVATDTITGLTWLEGETVNILADGAVMQQQTVSGGSITMEQPGSVVQVGLPLTSEIQSLPAGFLSSPGAGQGRPKNVNKVFLRVVGSGGIKAGPDVDNLIVYKVRTIESPGSPPNLISDEIEIGLSPSWSTGGQLVVQQTDPLPVTILSMTPEFAVGS